MNNHQLSFILRDGDPGFPGDAIRREEEERIERIKRDGSTILEEVQERLIGRKALDDDDTEDDAVGRDMV